MHATIDVRFTVSIGESKTIPLAILTELIIDQTVGSILPESMVEAHCGQKSAHDNGNERFQRAVTDIRTAVTTAGKRELRCHFDREVGNERQIVPHDIGTQSSERRIGRIQP
jgi:hypothetical protein